MNYDTFRRVAVACNFAASFNDNLKLTDTGKVDARNFASIMEHDAKYLSPGCVTGYSMLSILLAKDGIDATTFRWRGNATKGIEPHPMAAQYMEYATAYLREAFPSMRFDSVNTSTPKRRENLPAAILDALAI
jgi:hypothetical protein